MGKSRRRQQEAEDEGRPAHPKRSREERKERKTKKRRSTSADGADAAAQGEAPPPGAAAAGGEQPPDQQAGELQPAAGSHDADAAGAAQQGEQAAVAAAEPQRQQAGKARGGKPAPVLPWMRVPIAIEASEGVLLEEVKGLDPQLKAALEGGRAGALEQAARALLRARRHASSCTAEAHLVPSTAEQA